MGREAKATNWTPLLIVVGALVVATLATSSGTAVYIGFGTGATQYNVDFEILMVASLLAIVASVAAIALVVYSRESPAKLSLVIGIVLIVVQLVIRTEIYLRQLNS